jgi:hypothetical protein
MISPWYSNEIIMIFARKEMKLPWYSNEIVMILARKVMKLQ